MLRLATLTVFLLCVNSSFAAEPDEIINKDIKSVQLYHAGNQMSYPVVSLGSIGSVELHFDELGSNFKSYFYTYQLCDANWEPVNLSSFDYIRGFTQNRITTYRVSSIALTKYIHYQAILPERNSIPSRTGNYLIKVFTNGDTSQLAFTKRLLVTDNYVSIGAQLLQPFNPQLFRTHHKIQFTIDQKKLNILNPQQQLKVVVLQNWRWDNALKNLTPTFIRGNLLEYSGDNVGIFAAGKEYKWLDMRSFRFQTERMSKVDKTTLPWTVYVSADSEKGQQRYIFFRDYNGYFEITTTDNVNPFWQGDYGNVQFSLIPTDNQPFSDKEVYVVGQFNNYKLDEASQMQYNAEKGEYEASLLLKQGYYNYVYVTRSRTGEVDFVGPSYTETENEYTILVYYRPVSGRSDELIGVTTINSRNFIMQPGL